jgi:hypothetical protein
MTNKIRVSELEQYVQYWQDAQSAVEEIRDRLIDDQLNGNTLLDTNGDNVLPDRVRALDRTVIYHQKRLSFLRAVLNRAKAVDSVGKPMRLKNGSQPRSS